MFSGRTRTNQSPRKVSTATLNPRRKVTISQGS
jgi:hypothetical protein